MFKTVSENEKKEAGKEIRENRIKMEKKGKKTVRRPLTYQSILLLVFQYFTSPSENTAEDVLFDIK
jgi:hypothetical protein